MNNYYDFHFSIVLLHLLVLTSSHRSTTKFLCFNLGKATYKRPLPLLPVANNQLSPAPEGRQLNGCSRPLFILMCIRVGSLIAARSNFIGVGYWWIWPSMMSSSSVRHAEITAHGADAASLSDHGDHGECSPFPHHSEACEAGKLRKVSF